MTNTTTINAVAEAIYNTGCYEVTRRGKDECEERVPFDEIAPPYRLDIEIMSKAAIEAYEKASVKVMTVEEVAHYLFMQGDLLSPEADLAAKSLAKLGTIRIVGGGE